MPEPEAIAVLLIEYHGAGREAFLTQHRNPYLAFASAAGFETERWSDFNTATFEVKAVHIGTISEEILSATAKAGDLRLLEVAKSPDNPWRGRISLGRARNNDLVLNSSSVSKLHAHFTVDDGGTIQLVDAGSHNGTTVNGQRLVAGKPASVHAGDEIAFAELEAVLHSPESLCDLFGRLFV